MPARRGLGAQEQFALGQISCLHLAGGGKPGLKQRNLVLGKEQLVDMGNPGWNSFGTKQRPARMDGKT